VDAEALQADGVGAGEHLLTDRAGDDLPLEVVAGDQAEGLEGVEAVDALGPPDGGGHRGHVDRAAACVLEERHVAALVVREGLDGDGPPGGRVDLADEVVDRDAVRVLRRRDVSEAQRDLGVAAGPGGVGRVIVVVAACGDPDRHHRAGRHRRKAPAPRACTHRRPPCRSITRERGAETPRAPPPGGGCGPPRGPSDRRDPTGASPTVVNIGTKSVLPCATPHRQGDLGAPPHRPDGYRWR
jgi:hypothetical protein